MKYDDLIVGPCALPDAPLSMPKQRLEGPVAPRFALFFKRIASTRAFATVSVKAD